MKNKIIYGACAAMALVTVLYFFTTKRTQLTAHDATIVIGTNAEFPPFSFIDEQGAVTGFDIDVAKEVFKRLGKQMTIKDMAFDMLIPEIQQGSIHVIAA